MCVVGVRVKVRGHLREQILSFHQAGCGDQTQVLRFSSKHLYLLSLCSGPS